MYGSGSSYHQAKQLRKILISSVLWLLNDMISLETDVNVRYLQKVISKINLKIYLNTFVLFSTKIWWNVKEFFIKSLLSTKVPYIRFVKVSCAKNIFALYGTDWPGWDPPRTGRGSSRWRDRAGSPALWQSPAFQCRSSPPLCDPATVVNQSINQS